MHVRDTLTFIHDLTILFAACGDTGDIVGKDHIGKIFLALLGPPFNTEGKIMSQLIHQETVEDSIGVMQWGIGRRTAATGFMSKEARRATFKDPLRLPEGHVRTIHLLHSATFLKDLVPLLLEDGDAAGCTSILTVLLLQFKYSLLAELCKNPVMLPKAFQQEYFFPPTTTAASSGGMVIGGGSVEWGFELLAMLHDIMRCVKNVMIPLEPKEDLFVSAVEHGLFGFFVSRALRYSCGSNIEGNGNDDNVGEPDSNTRRERVIGDASGIHEVGVMMSCDVVSNVLIYIQFNAPCLPHIHTSLRVVKGGGDRRWPA